MLSDGGFRPSWIDFAVGPEHSLAIGVDLRQFLSLGGVAREKTMDESLITSDPKVMMGKPVIAGTRVRELILEKLAAGESVDQILAAHPRLTRQAVQAARAHDFHRLFDSAFGNRFLLCEGFGEYGFFQRSLSPPGRGIS